MDASALIGIYIATSLVSLAILYAIIRAGVKSGTTAALRAHEMWMRDGSLQTAIDAHAAAHVERQALRAHEARLRDGS